MIVAIGSDICDHEITERLKWSTDSQARSRVFSENESALYDKRKDLKFLAGRFAAKEAVLKCLGTGMIDGIALHQVEILQSKSGLPIVRLSGEAGKISVSQKIKRWHITISHASMLSMAFVVAEG